eukprot:SAG22_NODE_378_length_11517_cov_26.335523_2_plen_73_part_00
MYLGPLNLTAERSLFCMLVADFSPVFEKTDLRVDMDAENERLLAEFERTLTQAHGWCAVAKKANANANAAGR